MAGLDTTREAVRDRLDRVTDPELDRSIVDLGYVDEISLDLPRVRVRFSLPTAWCSPAFAWMMATDARDEAESLSDVDRAVVELTDHMHEAAITRGVNERLSFEAAFPDADGDVDEVRRDLDEKALLSRQYRAVSTLLDAGLSREQITRLTLARVERDGPARSGPRGDDVNGADDVENTDSDDATGADGGTMTVFVRDGAVGVTFPVEPLDAYLEKARQLGVVTGEDDLLFRTPAGEPISPDAFERVHHRTRLTATNMDGQGGICAYLHEARQSRQVEVK